MKKIIALILVAIMLTFALASCDILESLMPKQDPPAETRYTITAEEWAALDSELNYTVVSTGTSTVSYGTETHKNNISETFKSTANDKYELIKNLDEIAEKESSTEHYYTTKDGVRYILTYYENMGEWKGYEYEDDSSSILDYLVGGEEIKFEDLVYDADNKAYVATVTKDDLTSVLTLYFENGKLVKCIIEASGTISQGDTTCSAQATATCIFSDIGTTVVTLPEYTID